MGYTGVQKTRMEGFLMDIKTQIADKQAEIKKEISYLLWAVEKRLSARVNDADEHSGFKYPFSLKFDELPFFSLYVNLKKATYEHLLVLSHQANDLNDLDYSDLAKVGVTVEKGNLHFKGMKDFATKRVPFTDLDLLALEEYLNEIEASLLYSLFTDPVQAIYIKLQTNSCSENQNVDSEGRIVGGLQEDESGIDMDDLEILKTENNWSVFTSHNEMEDEDETEFVCPYGDEIARAYLEAKGINYLVQHPYTEQFLDEEGREKDIKLDRNIVLNVLGEKEYKKICNVLDTVVSVLTIPAYEVPDEVVLSILEQTYEGMKRVVFNIQLRECTNNQIFTKGEFMQALGVASEKFSKYTNMYGDKAFEDEQIQTALERIGQPTDFFNI